MGFFDYIKKCLTSHYANFSGRARRSEYFYYLLFNVIVTYGLLLLTGGMAFMTMDSMDPSAESPSMLPLIGWMVISLYLFIPSLAVLVRRLHDTNKSGWMALLGLIPLVNLVLLVFLFTEGTKGSNTYGPDPKNPESDTIHDQLV